MHDMLGIYQPAPRFSRQFAPVGDMMESALESYVDAVQSRSFPAAEHTVRMKADEWQAFQSHVAAATAAASGELVGIQHGSTPSARASTPAAAASVGVDVAPIRHVCVVGGGAMGSLLASKLNEVDGVAVTMLTRWHDHKAVVDACGLTRILPAPTPAAEAEAATMSHAATGSAGTTNGPIRTAASAEDVAAFAAVDLAIVAVKGPHTAAAAADCDAILAEDGGVVLTLQNGINHPQLQDMLGLARTVIPGVTTHGATMIAPGSVVHAGEGRTEIGVLVNLGGEEVATASTTGTSASAAAAAAPAAHYAVQGLLNRAGITTDLVFGADAVDAMLWRKLLVNAVINPLTAILDVRNGELRDPAHASLVSALVAEIAATATANGISMPRDPADLVATVLDETSENVSSMLADIRRGNATEIGQIGGPILEAARHAAVPTPVLQTIAALVRAKEVKAGRSTRGADEGGRTADIDGGIGGGKGAAVEVMPSASTLPSSIGAPPIVITTIADMQATSRASAGTVAFVPTMGGLHQGHLDLVRAARRLADVVVVSVFVNPKQFAAHEDFGLYPRQLESDCKMLHEVGADYVFAPSGAEMYPTGPGAVDVEVAGIEGLSEGAARPGFFKGVATVCAKLFNAVLPDHVRTKPRICFCIPYPFCFLILIFLVF